MLEKPHLPDEKIIAYLRTSYGLQVVQLEFLPIGYDAAAWVYRVSADDGQAYFLKVRRGALYEAGLIIPRYLKQQGLDQIVAPLPARAGQLWAGLDEFVLILYPFIEGRTGMEIGLTESQWLEFGAVLKAIHATRLPAVLRDQVKEETFSPRWSGMVRTLQAQSKDGSFENPFERELASIWRERAEEIARLVDRAEALGRLLRLRPPDFVLCHTDIHTANLLLGREGQIFIVDWDQPLFAPKERDLMFVVGGGIRTKKEEPFFRGYGNAEINPLALAYYRYEWVVQEIGDFGERVFLRKDIGEKTKKDSVRGFRELFEPDDVVEAAYQSEAHLTDASHHL